ncbi:hypothetical protein [Pseudoflavonifractor phocaeensis]|uniref:hypothetical protein n=1 Tax=Pseudoflavonifractor phocaeensis TaxID=1870988 RepID=UPI00210DB0DD|nr:hypothetical protein [Pseudoflavonifractor phocaeensis]MCQ4863868.1 hypothetical protein [Pseudoflavonifractor phocaeensis]
MVETVSRSGVVSRCGEIIGVVRCICRQSGDDSGKKGALEQTTGGLPLIKRKRRFHCIVQLRARNKVPAGLCGMEMAADSG